MFRNVLCVQRRAVFTDVMDSVCVCVCVCVCVQIEEKIQQLDKSLEGLIRNLEHRRKLHQQNLEAQVIPHMPATLFCVTVQ